MSVIGIVPYVGDLAKFGKIPKWIASIEKISIVVDKLSDVAKLGGKAAEAAKGFVREVERLLNKIPFEKLPDELRKPLETLRNKVEDFYIKLKKTDLHKSVNEGLTPIMANKGSKLIHTPREKALKELLAEAKKGNISINSDKEAQALLDWAARRQGVPPENIHAVTIGDEIFVRPQYAENVRVLREELIHVGQQKSGIGTNELVSGEVEARLKMIQNRHKWGLTNDEIREMIKEIRQIRKTGRY